MNALGNILFSLADVDGVGSARGLDTIVDTILGANVRPTTSAGATGWLRIGSSNLWMWRCRHPDAIKIKIIADAGADGRPPINTQRLGILIAMRDGTARFHAMLGPKDLRTLCIDVGDLTACFSHSPFDTHVFHDRRHAELQFIAPSGQRLRILLDRVVPEAPTPAPAPNAKASAPADAPPAYDAT